LRRALTRARTKIVPAAQVEAATAEAGWVCEVQTTHDMRHATWHGVPNAVNETAAAVNSGSESESGSEW
jgi:hydrogenase maturation factor